MLLLLLFILQVLMVSILRWLVQPNPLELTWHQAMETCSKKSILGGKFHHIQLVHRILSINSPASSPLKKSEVDEPPLKDGNVQVDGHLRIRNESKSSLINALCNSACYREMLGGSSTHCLILPYNIFAYSQCIGVDMIAKSEFFN